MKRKLWIVSVAAGAGTLVLATLLLKRPPDTTPGYLPNEKIRDRFARLDADDFREVTLNGRGIPLTKDEVEGVVAALRRSERRPYEPDGRPFRDATYGGGMLDFSRRERHAEEVPTVWFWVLDPSAHHGPAFARAIARPLALLQRSMAQTYSPTVPLGTGLRGSSLDVQDRNPSHKGP